MSRILDYFSNAVTGVGKYFENNKLVVLLLVTLFAAWLLKEAKEKENRMLVYTLVLTVCLLCPVTAVAVLVYQTAYYDYQWAFSMVPVTVVTAYGLAILLRDKLKQKRQFVVVLAAIIVLFFLGGNQGMLQRASETDIEAKAQSESIIESLSVTNKGERIVWAPKRIMQQLRRIDGEILLLYGRDMWDSKAGAYDYEAYPDAYTHAYEWLEEIMKYVDLAVELEQQPEYAVEWSAQYGLMEEAEEHLKTIVQSGANTIVLPVAIGESLEVLLGQLAQEEGFVVKELYTERYIIYLLN